MRCANNLFSSNAFRFFAILDAFRYGVRFFFTSFDAPEFCEKYRLKKLRKSICEIVRLKFVYSVASPVAQLQFNLHASENYSATADWLLRQIKP